MADSANVSVVILTRDEEVNLPRCLESFRELDAAVFVVDSGSTDRTLDIAQSAGCHVESHLWETYAAQLNWALDNLRISTPWVMRLDADERLTPELVKELNHVLRTLPADVTGLMLKRRIHFCGRWIKHGGCYPTWLLRIWRHSRARCEEKWMDEHMIVNGGRVVYLENDIIDDNYKGLAFWTEKHNRYSDREIRDVLAVEEGARSKGISGQAGRRRWVKENLYNRMPLFWRAFAYWGYRYILRFGFLDGTPGLVFHFLQGFWYRFLVDGKLYELRRNQRR